MNTKSILFFTESVSYQLRNRKMLRHWIASVIKIEKKVPGEISFIFCSDEYLRNLNIVYLNHDTYTDVITFDNSESNKIISGDIYISIERVRENARKLSELFASELHRVMIHGVLHLLEYRDKTNNESKLMREKENNYLNLLNQ